MSAQLDIFAQGEARKKDGMQAAWSNADDGWRDRALSGLLHLAATSTGAVQVCELRKLPGIGLPAKHQAWGSLPKVGASFGWLEPAGVQKSKLTTTHSSMLRAWVGTDRARDVHSEADCAWCGVAI